MFSEAKPINGGWINHDGLAIDLCYVGLFDDRNALFIIIIHIHSFIIKYIIHP